MPVRPRSPRPGRASPGPQLHQHRRIAESFGTDVGRYDRTRPAYPGALVEAIIAVSPGPDVLDVGCGGSPPPGPPADPPQPLGGTHWNLKH